MSRWGFRRHLGAVVIMADGAAGRGAWRVLTCGDAVATASHSQPTEHSTAQHNAARARGGRRGREASSDGGPQLPQLPQEERKRASRMRRDRQAPRAAASSRVAVFLGWVFLRQLLPTSSTIPRPRSPCMHAVRYPGAGASAIEDDRLARLIALSMPAAVADSRRLDALGAVASGSSSPSPSHATQRCHVKDEQIEPVPPARPAAPVSRPPSDLRKSHDSPPHARDRSAMT
jgi:hypothetical protein